MKRKWTCVELRTDYLESALGRFDSDYASQSSNRATSDCADLKSLKESDYYKLPKAGVLWNDATEGTLEQSGGKRRGKNTKDGRK